MAVSLLDTWRGAANIGRKTAAGELISTWQVGQEQRPPNDLRNFATEGYSKHGLIYACIKEKATSFAPLAPRIERRDGTHIDRHRVLEILERPNSTQDGTMFAETMATQYEAAGNVYIEKVRQSTNVDLARERRGWPVQELSLIRPDYVTIEPGATRDDDRFVVTIDGIIRRRLPRADVIHIREPSLVNDFYGLSKIALLTREADIDTNMTAYELAFFKNAGVPMGVLYVKGRYTEEQTRETKSRWKQALNGASKWWSLVVLNADEAKYQQLAIDQSHMEMSNTRDHIEARICSVFGVPPVIVGARIALSAGAQAPYEDAEHAFWAETMVPFTLRFARAYTAHLLPEFALVADAGAKITYDFTSVRALQEDRSRKLREVVRLVITGGFTVNQALVGVGLPAMENADFYVRNGNQVVVSLDGEITPMVEPKDKPDTQTPNEDNPLEGAAGWTPQVVKSPRCRGTFRGATCGKVLAQVLVEGSEVMCPRCHELTRIGEAALSEPIEAHVAPARTVRTIERDAEGRMIRVIEEAVSA